MKNTIPEEGCLSTSLVRESISAEIQAITAAGTESLECATRTPPSQEELSGFCEVLELSVALSV